MFDPYPRKLFEISSLMKIRFLRLFTGFATGIVSMAPVSANDSFNSELSHFAGNAAIAGVTTVVVDKYLPKVKKPALTGFIVSASEAVLGEVAERAMGQGPISALDIAAGTLGAAAGAYATDKWYIQPKLDTRKNETTASVMVVRRF